MVKENFQKRKIEEEPKVIEVGIDKWRVIKSGMIGETTPLGPCFGIIIHDPVSKSAIVGHFANPRSTINDFNNMLTEAKKLFSKNKERVKIYVGGGHPVGTNLSGLDRDKKERNFVKNTLQKTGFKIEKIKYHDSVETTTLIINTKTGVVNYDTTQDPMPYEYENEDENELL